MGTQATAKFEGFYPETLEFLREVRANNSKAWFEERRPEYERVLLEPMRALVGELGGFMLAVDPRLEVRPAVGKTISRIFRDTRFSKDKSLFRSNMWCSFRRAFQEWEDTPSFFFEINPDEYCYGMGFYLASRPTMAAFRKRLDTQPEQFLEAIRPLGSGYFELEGEQYRKPLGPAKPPELAAWYQRKNFYLIRYGRPGATLFSAELVRELLDGLERAVPLYHYLWETVAARDVSA
jgi:uncharacterized protein (TIGR02453 family)